MTWLRITYANLAWAACGLWFKGSEQSCRQTVLEFSTAMSAVHVVYFAVCANVLVCIVAAVKECHKLDQCRYSTDEGEVDLWSLAGKGNKPR